MYRVLCNGIEMCCDCLSELCGAGITIDDIISLLDGYSIVGNDGNIYEIEEL